MPRVDPTDAVARRISASAAATTGHLLTVYDDGDWSIWPSADAFAIVPAAELAALGITPDVPVPPPNGMRLYVTDGSRVVRAQTKADARTEIAKGGTRFLVALNPDLSLCSCSPPGAPRAAIDLVLAQAKTEVSLNGRTR